MLLPISEMIRYRGQVADPRNRNQQFDQSGQEGLGGLGLLVEASDPPLHLGVDDADRLLQRIVLVQMEFEQEAVMIGEPAVESVMELLPCGLQPSVAQRRQFD